MVRHILHLSVIVIICSLYSIFLFTAESAQPGNYILISNLVSFFLLCDIFIEIKSNHFLKKENFKSFSLTHAQLILRRITLLYKNAYMWKLTAIPPVILLFTHNISMGVRAQFYFMSVLQNVFTVYLFISLYDYLELKGMERHINILLPVITVTLIFIRGINKPALYFVNPFGGLINLPILLSGLLVYLVPVLIYILLYFFNVFFVHRQWLNN